MLKKRLLFSLCLLLMTGCVSNTSGEDEKLYILFATPLKSHTIWLQAKDGFEDACTAYQINCDWIGPNTIDTEKMNNVVETGILQGADGIITQGVIDATLIQDAKNTHIPIALVDSDEPASGRFLFMGKNFEQQATLLLEDIESSYGKKEPLKIAIQVAESKFDIALQQIQWIRTIFEQHEGGFEIVDISESKSDILRAKKEWSRVLTHHNDINVAINFAAESAEPCTVALQEHHLRNDVLIYGVDDMPATLDLIKRGEIDGSVVTSFYDYGYQSVENIVRYVKTGHKPEKEVIHPKLMIVHKGNVVTYRDMMYGKAKE